MAWGKQAADLSHKLQFIAPLARPFFIPNSSFFISHKLQFIGEPGMPDTEHHNDCRVGLSDTHLRGVHRCGKNVQGVGGIARADSSQPVPLLLLDELAHPVLVEAGE
jgi:hypothetical protein